MKKKLLSLLSVFTLLLPGVTAVGQSPLEAAFDAKESVHTVYTQSFDSQADINGWALNKTNATNSWYLGNPRKVGVPNFSAINPKSKYSLAINYDDRIRQNETLVSPVFTINPQSTCSFYACFDGVWTHDLYANFRIVVLNEQTQQRDTLFNAGRWAIESGHERSKWLYFNLDMARFAGQQVRFLFNYVGVGGDDVLVDDFSIHEKIGGDKAEVTEGELVHFEDQSTGTPTQWEWSFEGGTPATSTVQNPEVRYNKAGSYPVQLTVRDNAGNVKSVTKENFIVVKGVAPEALLKLPAEGYLTPYAGIFVPRAQPVTFTDASLHMPTSWSWTLPGADPAASTLQNPTVSYPKAGRYGVKLSVSNNQGVHYTEFENIVQAGDTLEIWNIEMEETETLTALNMGFLGFYGGSNWAGMTAFAEHFEKPVIPGSISEVSVFFAQVKTVSPDAQITVSVVAAKDSLPGGQILGSASMPVRDLVFDKNDWLPTIFKFSESIPVTNDFFIVVEGIPNNADDKTYETDEIVIGAVKQRPKGGKTTTYHQLEEWDDNDKPTGKLFWEKNKDELTSFTIAPRFTYDDKVGAGINNAGASINALCPSSVTGEIQFYHPGQTTSVQIVDLSGKIIYQSADGTTIETAAWTPGLYIVRAMLDGKPTVQKIQIVR